MKNYISEELPARAHPQANLSTPNKKLDNPKNKNRKNKNRSAGEDKSPEERISQAASDIRYRSRREKLPLNQAYSQYMQNSNMSEDEKRSVKEKIFGRELAPRNDKMKAENFDFSVDTLVETSVIKALFKVFVEENNQDYSQEYIEELKKDLTSSEYRKYKVRVTDKNGVSYVRYADRSKISSLRLNPNIESVEMTEYGTPYEGERSKGEKTSAALGGCKNNDKKAKKDRDGDGKVESSSKEHAGVVHNAIQRATGGVPDGKDTRKEEYLADGITSTNDKKKNMTPMPKGAKNLVTINPKLGGSNGIPENNYSKFLGKVKDLNEKSHCDSPEQERDTRGDYAKVSMIKNKLRAMGMKNPVIMVSSEKKVQEGMGLSVGISKAVGAIGANPRTSAEQGAKNFQKNIADPIGKAIKGAVKTVLQPADNSPKAQQDRISKRRPKSEEVELEGDVLEKYVLQTKTDRKIMPGDPPAASPAATVKPIGTTTPVKRQYENPYRARPGESD